MTAPQHISGVRTCLGCGDDLPPRVGPGRPRMYCSRACRALVLSIRGQTVRPTTRRRKRTDHRAKQNYGCVRALHPDEVTELRRRRREGWKLEHLATAYGVSTRTIARYMAMPEPVLVTVAGWQAYFVLGHRDHPLQVSAWEPATRISGLNAKVSA